MPFLIWERVLGSEGQEVRILKIISEISSSGSLKTSSQMLILGLDL